MLDLDYAEDSERRHRRQLRHDRRRATSSRCRPPPRRSRSARSELLALLALARKGIGQAGRPAEAGGDVTRWRRRDHRPPRDRHPQSGKLAEMRELLAPLRHRGGLGRRAGPARARGDRHDLRGERAHQGGSGRAGVRPAGVRRRFRASWSMRSAARPASTRRAGPDRTRISATRWSRSRLACASATRSRRHSARRISSRRCASPGRTATSRNSRARSTARWSGRRAATKGFGYDPMFLPDGFDRTFGEMTQRARSTACRRKGQGLSHRARAFLKLAEACLER